MTTTKTTPSEPTGTQPTEHSLVPVYYKGLIQLYDIYVEGTWQGSRRTIKQCHETIRKPFKWWKDYRIGYHCRVEAPTYKTP